MKEQSHASDAKVTITIANAIGCVNLWIGPQISNTLYVDNYQLVSRALKREMTERLQRFNVHC